ncbi:protein kinase [Pendulispora rubella]|uniref:Protein kinase n=1 Tax=Pendulispora rubella TaxID=2741070 RepID=A0ABZ2LHX8_9BACT
MVAGVGYLVSSKYRLVRLLGDGGMGSVYEALHEVLGTRVAIKLLHPELAHRTGLIDRFMQEARVAAQIQSPHIVQVTDVDRTPEGVAYIVMELLQGEALSSVLERERKVPIAVACEYTKQILEALEVAHALGVTHRDLKPENVFVTFVAGKPVLKLIDFGIAKFRTSEPGVTPKNLTVAGVVMGTAEYMAPEQAYSADRADARSDIYAVGVMLYEMIAGVRPVEGDADARIIAARVEQGDVKPLVHAAPDVPRELAGLVHRAMAARPELRFASATEMRIALEKVSLAPDAGRVPTKKVAAVPAPVAIPAGPGTVLGAPAEAVFAASAGTSAPGSTVLGPPLPAPYPAQAVMQAPPPYSPPQGYERQVPAPRHSGTRGSRAWLWVLLPVVLGVGGVIAYAATSWQEESASPSVPTTPPTLPVTAQASLSATAPAATTTPPSNTVAPLVNATTAAPRPTPHPSSKPSSTPPPSASGSGGAVPFPSVSLPPITLPSGFPTTLPSGFPTTLPSGFPTAIPSTLPPIPPVPPPYPPPASS